MGRLTEALRRPLRQDKREPGLLELHMGIALLVFAALRQITVRIPKEFEISDMRSFRSDYGEIPFTTEEKEEVILTVPRGCRMAIKIDGEENLFDDTKKHPNSHRNGKAVVGGVIMTDRQGNYFSRGGKRFSLSRRVSQLAHKGKKLVTATYEPGP